MKLTNMYYKATARCFIMKPLNNVPAITDLANDLLEMYNDVKVSFSKPEPLEDRGSIKRWSIKEYKSGITFEFSIDPDQGNYDMETSKN